MMSVLRILLSAAALSFGLAAVSASASVRIRIDLSSQRLEATTPDGESVAWKISSGRRGFETPSGSYKVYRMEADHLSDEYDQAPMPYAMFFSPRGLAIHGTYERGLGRPASHGCVRLSVDHARQLYEWVEKKGGATVEIYGGTPAGGRKARVAEGRRERLEAEPEIEQIERPRRRRVREPIETLDPETGSFESFSRY